MRSSRRCSTRRPILEPEGRERMDVDSLYQEIILDHYKHPHGRGLREPYDAEVHHVNPTCGDEVTLRVRVADGVVGKPVDDALAVHEEFLRLMQSKGAVEPDEAVLEDAVAFAGVSKYPSRVKCALLGWMAWKDATAQAVAAREGATT